VSVRVIHGDSLTELARLEPGSVHAVVCDPPYGLADIPARKVTEAVAAWVSGDTEFVPAQGRGFRAARWDRFVPPPALWERCARLLPPGGHLLVFAGARTQDLMGLSLRLAGLELRDAIGWAYGGGMLRERANQNLLSLD